jgi:outer membrane protein assembly factor BamB
VRSLSLAAALMVASCGGGGGGGGSGGGSPPAIPLSVSVAASSLDVTGREDESAVLTIDLRRTGSASTPVVPDLRYDTTRMTLQGVIAVETDGVYRLRFASNPALALGDYVGTIEFRLCQEAACTNVYPNTAHALPYRISVSLKDWSTAQRDATHRGFVNLPVNPSQIAQIWETYIVIDAGFASLGRPAADNARVYLSSEFFHPSAGHQGGVFALNIADGSLAWGTELGPVTHVSDPAVANGRVYVAHTDSLKKFRTFLDATGSPASETAYEWQFGEVGTPTPIGDEVYISAGQFGGVTFSYQQIGGALRWRANATDMTSMAGSPIWYWESIAADADHVYRYNGRALDVFGRADGHLVTSVADPAAPVTNGYRTLLGGPIVLPDRTIISYSGTMPDFPSGNRPQATLNPLVRFVPATGSIAWRTAEMYSNTPAANGSLLFAARSNPARLDAINVSDGSVAWSWTPPDLKNFVGNIIATQNMLFVSTTTTTYGLDLATRAVVWSFDKPGDLAIAPGKILLISHMRCEPNCVNAGRISAFRLASPPGLSPASFKGEDTRAQSIPIERLDLSQGFAAESN